MEKDQGLEYKDGAIVSIEPKKEPTEYERGYRQAMDDTWKWFAKGFPRDISSYIEGSYKNVMERNLKDKCMTTEEKGKAFDIVRKKIALRFGSNIAEEIFSEFEEPEDEKIRKAIHIYLDWLDGRKDYAPKGEYSIRDMIAWLKKQGQVKEPQISQHENETCKENGNSLTSEDERIRKTLIHIVKYACDKYGIKYKGKEIGEEKLLAWIEKQGEQRLCMIQWKGDNLKEVINFTGKDKNFDKWFKSFEEYEKYVHEHNDIFKLFNEDGSHYEVPVGAWIVKTPDGYNVASKAVLKQKSDDKVEPKFHEGEWGIDKEDGTIFQIVKVLDNTYAYKTNEGKEYSCTHYSLENDARLWTIQDAKDGDVLVMQKTNVTYESIFIFNKIENNRIIQYLHYFTTDADEEVCEARSIDGFLGFVGTPVHPATTTQRDTLMKAMTGVGYTFDFEKKELKKVEHKSVNTYCREHCKGYQLTGRCFAYGEYQAKRDNYKKLQQKTKETMSDKPAEWSEEDEVFLRDFVEWFEINAKAYEIHLPMRSYDIYAFCKDIIKKLRKIKNLMLSSACSEEDEQYLLVCKNALAKYQTTDKWDACIISHWLENKLKSIKERTTWKPSDLPHWKKSNLPDDNSTGFNSDYFCYKGYNINYKELFEKLPKND